MTTSLLVHATGSVSCWNLPFWLTWLREQRPDLDLHVSLSRTAATFVSGRTVEALLGRAPFVDTWDRATSGWDDVSPHTVIAQRFDAVVVNPASMDFVSRLAHGSGSTPVLTALQTTRAPVVVAPSMPPGAPQSAAVRRNLALLAEDPRFHVAEMTTVASMATGEQTTSGATPLPETVETALGLVAAARAT